MYPFVNDITMNGNGKDRRQISERERELYSRVRNCHTVWEAQIINK